MNQQEILQYLIENNDYLVSNQFWIKVAKQLPQGQRQVKIYYMLYYTRRFYPPLGWKNRVDIAQLFYELIHSQKYDDINDTYEKIILQYHDYHPQVVKQACQNIYYMHFKRHKPWSQILASLQSKGQISGQDELEKQADTKFYNLEYSDNDDSQARDIIDQIKQRESSKQQIQDFIEPAQKQETKLLEQQSGSNQEETEFYSFSSSDSEFNRINQPIRYKTTEQYEKQLAKLVQYRAQQLRGIVMEPLDLYIYYEDHKQFFESLWGKVKFTCIEVQKSPANHFTNIQITRALPELNQQQQQFLMDHFDDFFRKTVQFKDILVYKYSKLPIFKNKCTKKSLRLFMSNVERKFSSNERRRGPVQARKVIFDDFNNSLQDNHEHDTNKVNLQVNDDFILQQKQLFDQYELKNKQIQSGNSSQESEQRKSTGRSSKHLRKQDILEKEETISITIPTQNQTEESQTSVMQDQSSKVEQGTMRQIKILDIQTKQYSIISGVAPDFNLLLSFYKKLNNLKLK
ncbi:hypothetical protein SS50377_22479 [Spironucleus salmonicida]|nr:hypothetical protein SS50377_22479 [Spironucleus salmonicida]